jgi:hypothetical protein
MEIAILVYAGGSFISTVCALVHSLTIPWGCKEG